MWSKAGFTCNLHEFVLVRAIACLLSFYLFRLAARNGSNHCIGPKKKTGDIACLFARLFACCLFICFVWPHAMAPAIASDQTKNRRHCFCLVFCCCCLFVCFFVCSLVCLCVLFPFPLFLFWFLCFLIIDVPINLKILTNILSKNRRFYQF